MDAAHLLRQARRRAGLSQRQLARRGGVPQPTIARIETGRTEPRFGLLQRLLAACDTRLVSEPIAGRGVDRTAIREMLELPLAERLALAVEEARNLAALEEGARRPRDEARP
jgi:transcriptional regulator with XRE-family HTH domain